MKLKPGISGLKLTPGALSAAKQPLKPQNSEEIKKDQNESTPEKSQNTSNNDKKPSTPPHFSGLKMGQLSLNQNRGLRTSNKMSLKHGQSLQMRSNSLSLSPNSKSDDNINLTEPEPNETDNNSILNNESNESQDQQTPKKNLVIDPKEQEILNDVEAIQKSIDQLLIERRDIQLKHKAWLDDRKKKIFQMRKETNQIEHPEYIKNPNLFIFSQINQNNIK